MDKIREIKKLTRRAMLQRCGMGMGSLGLWSLLQQEGLAGQSTLAPKYPHFAPKAKSVIWIFTNGGPSQVDTWDYKPALAKRDGQTLEGFDRFTGFFANSVGGLMKSPFEFKQHGQSGAWLSELLPGIGAVADEICFIKSMHTEAINHSPGMTLFMTGSQIPGRPSMGAWLNYGLGSPSDNLPGYIVMISKGRGGSQALYSRLWGSGFLPSKHQGVKFRSSGEPVLYLSNPKGVSREVRRGLLDDLAKLNEMKFREVGDPEIITRISQYEMAYRMQMSVPELVDISKEPKEVLDLYGAKPGDGSFASNCLLARRLAEPDMVVATGTPVLELQNNQHVEVSVDLPESAALSLPLDSSLKAEGELVIADLSLPLTYKEHSTQPRQGSRTYRLTLKGEPPEDYNLLPGMAMRVRLQRPPTSDEAPPRFRLPLSAVQTAPDGSHYLWLAVDGHARRQPVALDGVEQDHAVLGGELKDGMLAVVAGGSKLSEDQPINAERRN